MEDGFEYYVDGIAITVVSIFGLIGTLMSIRVLLKPSMKNSFSMLLAGLATCDSNFLAGLLLIIGLPKCWDWYSREVSIYLIPVVFGMLGVARTGSVYFTMAVTLERYFAIVRPLAEFRAKKYLFPCTFLFAIVYNIPRFFELERHHFHPTNETMVGESSLRRNYFYSTIYMMWMKLIVLELLPYFTIIILNGQILRTILKSYIFRQSFRTLSTPSWGLNSTSMNSQMIVMQSRLATQSQDSIREPPGVDRASSGTRKNSSNPMRSSSPEIQLDSDGAQHAGESSGRGGRLEGFPVLPTSTSRAASSGNAHQQQEINLGITLISISLLFIVCQSVKLIPDVYELLLCDKKNICNTTPFIDLLTSLANLLSCINSAANFLVYMLRGEKFRNAFLTTYSCKTRSARSRQMSRTAASMYI